MDFYLYYFDFSLDQQTSSIVHKSTVDYDGSSLSEQDEEFMFDIDL